MDLAIDLGTANTLIYSNGSIQLNERSIIATNTYTHRIEALGTEAYRYLGNEPRGIQVDRPLKDGTISDFDANEKMLSQFLKKIANSRFKFKKPRFKRIIIGMPTTTQVEERAIRDCAKKFLKARGEVILVEEAVAAAIGAGVDLYGPAHMIVDIGGGTTDIAIIGLGGAIYNPISVKAGGDVVDERIQKYLKDEHKLQISIRQAERIKIEIGTAQPPSEGEELLACQVKGRDIKADQIRIVNLNESEIRNVIEEAALGRILEATRQMVTMAAAGLAEELTENGIVLCGGGALLKRIASRVRDEIGLPTRVAEKPLECVVLGAGKMLSDHELLSRVERIPNC